MKNRRCVTTVSLMLLLIALTAFVQGCASTSTTPSPAPESPPEAKALRRLGEAYIEQGNYTSALRYFLEAEKLAPEDHVVQFDLGETYIQKKLFDKAIFHFQKAIQLKPDYSAARNSLGSAYILNKEYDKAIAVLSALLNDEAFSIYATPHFPKTNLGWAYYFDGQYPKAEEAFLSALQFYKDGLTKDMTYLRVLRGLGLTYLAEGRPDDAIRYLEMATEVKEYTGQIIYMDLARAYRAKGDKERAAQIYHNVIAADPDGEFAEEAKAALNDLQR